MSVQRTRLAKYLNQAQRFRGTFSEIRHDKQNKPQILLLNVYPIYSDGRKVPLRSQPELTDKYGHQIACDHVWVSLSQDFLKLPKEALYGDILNFTAKVIAYPIVRDNVLAERNQYWEKGQDAYEEVYHEYQRQRDTILEARYLATQEAIEKAYTAYKEHLLTFQEMKKAQNSLKRDFHKASQKLYQSMKAKQKRRIKTAQRKIQEIKTIDYGLTQITQVSFYKPKQSNNIYREDYNPERYNDLKYTKYLAYHSMSVKEESVGDKIG